MDAVRFGVGAHDISPGVAAAVGSSVPGGEKRWVAQFFLDLEEGFLVLGVALL